MYRKAFTTIAITVALALVILPANAASRSSPIHEKVYTERDFELLMIDGIRDYIRNAMRAAGAPGLNIALAYRGRLIWEAGFGWADVAAQEPMTPATVYHSGSLGKTYTATAIMQLVDKGVIDLQDPINQHLPFEVHNPKGERNITVFDLMTHTSGLGPDSALSLWTKPQPLAEELADEYGKEFSPNWGGQTIPRWQSKVGEQWSYSNLGVATLGLIVETTNPEDLAFSDYVQKYIMDPLGMQSAQYPPSQHKDWVRPEIWAAMSTGYSSMGSAWIPTIPVYFGEAPAGSALGRPSDHLRLLLAMMNGGSYNGYQVLKPETVKLMLTPQDINGDPVPGSIEQGLIWRLTDLDKRTESFSHAGGHMFGWSTEGQAWPELDTAVMVAVNQWRLPKPSLGMYEVSKFVGEWISSLPPDVELSPASADWSWKVSYVRGALIAALYTTATGIPGPIPQAALESSLNNTRIAPGGRGDWNPEAYRQGIEDISATGLSPAAVAGFWQSAACKVSYQDVRKIYTELGGKLTNRDNKLFPPGPEVAEQNEKD